MSTFYYSTTAGVGQMWGEGLLIVGDGESDTCILILLVVSYHHMGQLEKLAEVFLREPPEVSFDDVVTLLEAFGYSERQSSGGSHRIFAKLDCPPVIVPTVKGRKVKRVYIRRIVDILGLEEWYEEHRGT